MKAQVKVQLWDPKSPRKPRYRTYSVPYTKGDKVLGSLIYIHNNLDPCLAFRFNCRGRHCGECSMTINGKPGLACAVPMSPSVVLEPLRNLPVVKDLVIDRGSVYRQITESLPVITGQNPGDGKLSPMDMDVLERIVKLDDCIQCLCCMAICPAYKKDPEAFPGPAALLALATAAEQGADIDLKEKAELCTECGLCEKICPRGIPICSEAIKKIKHDDD